MGDRRADRVITARCKSKLVIVVEDSNLLSIALLGGGDQGNLLRQSVDSPHKEKVVLNQIWGNVNGQLVKMSVGTILAIVS